MNVLVLTNMRPSKQQPYAGIFVVNQFEKLKQTPGISATLFSMERKFTGFAGSTLKYTQAIFRFVPMLFRKFHVLHVHFFYPFILLAHFYRLFHRNAKIVVTFHGSDITSHINSSRSIRFFSRIARKTDYLIAVSHNLSDTVSTKLGSAPDLVMCAGIDRSVFYKMDAIKKEYDFIFAGSLTYLKGADLVIEAIKSMNTTGIRLCIAGSGPYRDSFIKLGKEYSIDLKEKQNQQQLRELFNKSRFLVLPSRQESFGLVVTEAMYCGTPGIVSQVGGLPEQINDTGNGFFIEELSCNALKKALEYALALPEKKYQQMAENALVSNKNYSLDTVCDTTASIYKALSKDDKYESRLGNGIKN